MKREQLLSLYLSTQYSSKVQKVQEMQIKLDKRHTTEILQQDPLKPRDQVDKDIKNTEDQNNRCFRYTLEPEN